MNEALHQELAKLRERNEYLEAEIAVLKEIVPGGSWLPLQSRFNLTNQEAKLLFLLADGKPRAKDWICEQICVRSYDVNKLADVVVCKVRKKIAPLKLITHWGRGYQIDPESLPVIQAVIGGAQ